MPNTTQTIDLENVRIKLSWRQTLGLVTIVVSIVGTLFAGFYSLKSDIKDIRIELAGIHYEMDGIHKELDGIHKEIDGIHQEITSIKVIIGKEQVLRKMEYRDRFDKGNSPYKDSVLYYDFINDTLYFRAKKK